MLLLCLHSMALSCCLSSIAVILIRKELTKKFCHLNFVKHTAEISLRVWNFMANRCCLARPLKLKAKRKVKSTQYIVRMYGKD